MAQPPSERSCVLQGVLWPLSHWGWEDICMSHSAEAAGGGRASPSRAPPPPALHLSISSAAPSLRPCRAPGCSLMISLVGWCARGGVGGGERVGEAFMCYPAGTTGCVPRLPVSGNKRAAGSCTAGTGPLIPPKICGCCRCAGFLATPQVGPLGCPNSHGHRKPPAAAHRPRHAKPSACHCALRAAPGEPICGTATPARPIRPPPRAHLNGLPSCALSTQLAMFRLGAEAWQRSCSRLCYGYWARSERVACSGRHALRAPLATWRCRREPARSMHRRPGALPCHGTHDAGARSKPREHHRCLFRGLHAGWQIKGAADLWLSLLTPHGV